MDYKEKAVGIGAYFYWGPDSEQVREIEAALRQAAAEAFREAANRIAFHDANDQDLLDIAAALDKSEGGV